MTCSLAQYESNKKNAMRSSGPRTPHGKMRSRENSFKHGLTGAGIVLPTEDAAEFDARFATLEAEMKPASETARQLVLRIALMLLRLDRSALHEAKAIAHRMRKARAEFDDARLAEVENYYSWIASEPATNARRLRSSPEGIDLLIRAMEGQRSDLTHPDGHRWDWQHCEHLHHLMGLRRMDVPVTRARALTEAITGNFKHLDKADAPDLGGEARERWAGCAMLDLIDSEIAKLRTLREGLDLEGLELDRAEAAHRAIFDASPEAVLARKYEAASERGLYRAFKEFREIQGEFSEVEHESELASDPPDELGSCLPEPPEEEVKEANIDPIVPEIAVPAVQQPVEGGSRRPTGRKRSNRRGISGQDAPGRTG
jgi:hypothetical protein